MPETFVEMLVCIVIISMFVCLLTGVPFYPW